MSLVVDGKTLESRPLKVMADPEVVLTEAERKKLFDMAMEMHELQRRANEVAAGIGPLNTRLTELSKEAASKSDLPADLKASVDTLQKDVAELAPKLAMPAVRRARLAAAAAAAAALLTAWSPGLRRPRPR